MSKLLRSEEMTLVQIFLSQEASYNCIRELGELVSRSVPSQFCCFNVYVQISFLRLNFERYD